MLFTVFMFLFVLVSFLLIVVILLQSSKGDCLSGALGGGFMAQSVVGVRQAANVLQKATIFLGLSFAVLAIVISITIGDNSTEGTKSILQERAVETQSQSQLPVLQNTGNDANQLATPADTTK